MQHCGYVTKLKNLRAHSNADRLQVGECFGNQVIVSLDYYNDQLGVYFPTDLQLSPEFCAANDLVRRKDENGNNCGGYLDPNKRKISTIRLRGEVSDGMFLPITCLAEFTKISDLREGDTIDVLNGVEICKKYIPPINKPREYRAKQNKTIKVNFAPTFYPHVDTMQLAYNLDKFHAGDIVELTLKLHGTSGRTGYLPLVKTKRSWWDRFFGRKGKNYKEYDYVTGSRRVVLDNEADVGFYGDNEFRYDAAYLFTNKLHKGETAYYEIVGFVNQDTPIMASVPNSKVSDKSFTTQYGPTTVFSYGCRPVGLKLSDQDTSGGAYQHDVYVYRMTSVNEDGDVVEYSPDQMRARCEQIGVKTVPLFERFIIPEDCDVGEFVLREVERFYNGPDPIGRTHVREGVVARVVNRPTFEAYKHKNISFKILEGICKDTATEPDMEELQDVEET